MGRCTLALAALASVAVLGSGCGSGSSQAVAVVKSFYGAVNANDIDTAMRFVSEEAVFINPTGTYEGRARIRDFLQSGASGGIVFHHSNFRESNGRVVYNFDVTQNGNSVASGMDGLTVVVDGKIYFDGTEGNESAR